MTNHLCFSSIKNLDFLLIYSMIQCTFINDLQNHSLLPNIALRYTKLYLSNLIYCLSIYFIVLITISFIFFNLIALSFFHYILFIILQLRFFIQKQLISIMHMLLIHIFWKLNKILKQNKFSKNLTLKIKIFKIVVSPNLRIPTVFLII